MKIEEVEMLERFVMEKGGVVNFGDCVRIGIETGDIEVLFHSLKIQQFHFPNVDYYPDEEHRCYRIVKKG